MKKKWVLILASALLSIGLLAGCSSGGNPADTGQNPTEAPASTEPAAPGTDTGSSDSSQNGEGTSGEGTTGTDSTGTDSSGTSTDGSGK
jgi:hypothetical protein